MKPVLFALLLVGCTTPNAASQLAIVDAGETCDAAPPDLCAAIICAAGEQCSAGVCVLECGHARCLQLMASCALPSPPAAFRTGACTGDEVLISTGECMLICGVDACRAWWESRAGESRRVP